MTRPRKIVLHSLTGYRPELDALVAEWMQRGVFYVGVVGVDASRIEDIIDELVLIYGESGYEMLTAYHSEDESLDDAKKLAAGLTGEFGGPFEVIEF